MPRSDPDRSDPSSRTLKQQTPTRCTWKTERSRSDTWRLTTTALHNPFPHATGMRNANPGVGSGFGGRSTHKSCTLSQTVLSSARTWQRLRARGHSSPAPRCLHGFVRCCVVFCVDRRTAGTPPGLRRDSSMKTNFIFLEHIPHSFDICIAIVVLSTKRCYRVRMPPDEVTARLLRES